MSAAVADRWRIDVESISYEAVGGGSHHWLLRTPDAGYRFLTVDDLGTKPWLAADSDSTFAALEAAFRTASKLRASGLDFVVAPIPTADGAVVTRFDGRFSALSFHTSRAEPARSAGGSAGATARTCASCGPSCTWQPRSFGMGLRAGVSTSPAKLSSRTR